MPAPAKNGRYRKGRLRPARVHEILKGSELGCWEDELDVVCVFKDPVANRLCGRVIWHSSEAATYPVKRLHTMCPKKMLDFYSKLCLQLHSIRTSERRDMDRDMHFCLQEEGQECSPAGVHKRVIETANTAQPDQYAQQEPWRAPQANMC